RGGNRAGLESSRPVSWSLSRRLAFSASWRSGVQIADSAAGQPGDAAIFIARWSPRRAIGTWRIVPFLASVVVGAGLARGGGLDLAGVLDLLLDLLDDVAGEPDRLEIVDLLGVDDDAHLAAGLDRERLLDAGEGVGDLLERLEPADVVLDR